MTKYSGFRLQAIDRLVRYLLGASLSLLPLSISGCEGPSEHPEAMEGNTMAPATEGDTAPDDGTAVPDGRVATGNDASRGRSPGTNPPDAGAVPRDAGVGLGMDAGPLGDAGPSGDAATPMNCTPVAWENPGKVPNPEITAPPDAGQPWNKSEGLAEFDYAEEEFFFKGSAPAYTSRMLVHRPKDPAKFSGTVFVEWYNVTGGFDFAVLWAHSRDYFMREGHVHVGVSAQAVGANSLKDRNAARYAAIEHPGDDAANAIYSQAAAAIRSQGETLLGPCMPVRTLLSVGQSQSAGMLARYVDEAKGKDRVYDGHLLHSGFGPPASAPDVPVFVISTMNEADGTAIDEPTLVEWEVAATNHNDAHLSERGKNEVSEALGLNTECVAPLNGFPGYWVYNAALDWLDRWAGNGERPPPGAPYQTNGSGIARDQDGNVLGGVRIQDIEVPIATYGMDNAPQDALDFLGYLVCGLGGSTTPFTKERLTQLYPSHEEYVIKYTQAADKAVADGYLLRTDYEQAIEKATKAPIPN